MNVQPQDLRALLDIAFTDEQLSAITAPLEPGVIIAGAGSGKTTVMAARVVWLVVSGQVRPEQVLGLTFTNKAAAELSGRIRTALAVASAAEPKSAESVAGVEGEGEGEVEGDGEPTVSTYHAYAGRLLREHGLWIGVEPDARLLADATRFQVADRVIRRASGPFVSLDKTIGALVDDVASLDGELNEHLVPVDRLLAENVRIRALVAANPAKPTINTKKVDRIAQQRSELAELVQAVRVEKQRLGVLDFGDQLALAARLVREQPAVGTTERERYRVVLLDEYQDTSVAQVRLLTDLFGDAHPVTAVGDPFQAIYGWRGASVRGIGDFPTTFRRADGTPARRYGLAQNNRSGSQLLDLANDLAAPLRLRHPEVLPLAPRPDLVGHGDTRCALFATHAEEVRWITDGIAAEIAAGRSPRDIAVLVRVRSDFAAYHEALVTLGVPVEVVGLGGLLALPEVADLVAMLQVLDDATANPALVRLLAGPRWRIGPRDLVLLGRRAAQLVRGVERADAETIEHLLEAAVAGSDPSEVVSLTDALQRPGAFAYSPEALDRFRLAATEIRYLRRQLGSPLLDLMHRVISVTGLDVEVGAAPFGPKTRRSDALGAFLEVAARFVDLDGDPSLRAFLGYLRAADEFERGLESAAPTASDSVKLLTVHKAKGLEWPVVVLPDLTADVFPAKRGRTKWTTSAATLPFALRGDAADFPVLHEVSNKALAAFDEQLKAADAIEELRLAYVAVTRAKSLLVASSHWWGPTQKTPRGPSNYLVQIRQHCLGGGGVVGQWAVEPEEASNPYLAAYAVAPWPAALEPGPLQERRRAAAWVRSAMAGEPDAAPDARSAEFSQAEQAEIAGWDKDLTALLDEARRNHHKNLDVPLPDSLSASALVRLASDPDGLARDLARPMPRPPAPAASRGTRFHSWVESLFGERPLLDRTDLDGAADDDLVPDESLAALQRAFLEGPYATQAPHRIEAPFQLVLDGRIIRGRIDAVYRSTDAAGLDHYDVIDWKTGRQPADPLQLAVYRAAWARIAGVAETQVRAGFYYVAAGKIKWHEDLPGAEDLAGLLRPAESAKPELPIEVDG